VQKQPQQQAPNNNGQQQPQRPNSNKNGRRNQNGQPRTQENALERTIVGLGRKGKTDEALAIYAEIPKPALRHLNGVIDACARARPPRLQQAFDIFHAETQTWTRQETEKDKEPQRSPKLQPNVFTFGALMSACARARRGDRARALLKTMQVCTVRYCRNVCSSVRLYYNYIIPLGCSVIMPQRCFVSPISSILTCRYPFINFIIDL